MSRVFIIFLNSWAHTFFVHNYTDYQHRLYHNLDKWQIIGYPSDITTRFVEIAIFFKRGVGGQMQHKEKKSSAIERGKTRFLFLIFNRNNCFVEMIKTTTLNLWEIQLSNASEPSDLKLTKSNVCNDWGFSLVFFYL